MLHHVPDYRHDLGWEHPLLLPQGGTDGAGVLLPVGEEIVVGGDIGKLGFSGILIFRRCFDMPK